MHAVFYEVFLSQNKKIETSVLKTSCYGVFERNDIIETTAAHFFKKVRWLS